MRNIKKITAFSAAVCMAFSQTAMISPKADASNQSSGICVSYADNAIPSGALYSIKSIHSNKLLTADDDTNVCQRDDTNTYGQHWRIVQTENGYIKLLSETDLSMALTVEDATVPNGSNIGIAEYSGADTQQFKLNKNGSSYYITTKASGDKSSLDIKGKSKSEGANVHQYKYQGNTNQLFEITPVGNVFSWIKGDMNFDGIVNAFDLAVMRKGIISSFDDTMSGIADVTADGQTDANDLSLLTDFILSKKKGFPEKFYTKVIDTPQPAEGTRKMEYLNRGVSAVSTGDSVFVSWRLLADDDENTAFNVYRTTDNVTTKLNDTPLSGGTNYTDKLADLSKNNTYTVKSVISGIEYETDDSDTLSANSTSQCKILNIKQGGKIHFVWVGDYDGDGEYDYLVDRNADEHQKLEAYKSDGTYLWTIDLGYNSENKNNISPGASAIDVGMWDGATVYDMDCDGYADVILRIADGVTFGDGSVFQNSSDTTAQFIAVIDGRTGAVKDYTPVPDDFKAIGPMACMMEIGYLDGVNPSIICWMKNRNSDKTFNSMTAAFGFENGEFKLRWKYINDILFTDRTEYKNGYAEAHQIRVADVDYDGKDEVLHMGYCLNGDGTLRYHVDEIVHGDRWFVGSFSNENNGKEMYGYGIQQNNQYGLLEYFYNASTGEMIWTNYAKEGTADVGRGNIGDIDPRYEGFEVWSFQGLYNNDGTRIGDNSLYPCIRLWWDGDLLAESYNDTKFEKWNYQTGKVERLLSPWKITDSAGSDRGAPMFYGDIFGDWREEVVMTSSDYSKLVIFCPTAETDTRLYCLAQNPCYRNCMTAKGYFQSHMLDYYLGTGMEQPERPDISIIKK